MATKRKKKGITFPALTTPDTGIRIVRTARGDRYKVWYRVEGRMRLVSLPPGTSLAEARERRNNLYSNLRVKFGAKRYTPRSFQAQFNPRPVSRLLRPTQYVYLQPATYVVRIQGRKIAEAKDVETAILKRDAWLRENGALVPHIKMENAQVMALHPKQSTTVGNTESHACGE